MNLSPAEAQALIKVLQNRTIQQLSELALTEAKCVVLEEKVQTLQAQLATVEAELAEARKPPEGKDEPSHV